MKPYLSTVLAFLILLTSHAAYADKSYRVVILGDSLTAGQQVQAEDAISAKLARKIREVGYGSVSVVNLSKPDATTSSAMKDVDLVKGQLPDVVILVLGINDIMQGTSAQAIHGNIARIVTSLRSLNAYILLVGVPAPAETGQAYQYDVQRAYYALAKDFSLPFYYSALAGIEGNPEYTMADGMHPNSQGIDIMVEGLFPFVDAGLRWRYEVFLHDQEVQRQRMMGGAALSFP